MSEQDPIMIRDVDDHVPTALDIVMDYIETIRGASSISGSYQMETQGIQRFAELLPGGEATQTFGVNVKIETYRIALSVIADSLQEAQDELMELRYLLISAGGRYASRGLDLINVAPAGTIVHNGPDANGRQMVEAEFFIMTGPSYV